MKVTVLHNGFILLGEFRLGDEKVLCNALAARVPVTLHDVSVTVKKGAGLSCVGHRRYESITLLIDNYMKGWVTYG